MANNSDAATNTKQLPTFSNLKGFEQLAVTLKADGQKYAEIVNTINAEYELAYKELTLRGWFMAGGRLEQAYLEYVDVLADQAVREAKTKIKRMSLTAANTLEDLMKDDVGSNARGLAARTVLAKYIPDRQIIVDETKTDDLPDELAAAADNIVKGGGKTDGQKPVDDPPKGEGDSGAVGPGGDETLPTELLQEPTAPDQPSNPPA